MRLTGAASTTPHAITANAVAETFAADALTHRPRGGYHLWVSLPAHTDSRQFAAAALANGVCVTPGDNYYANDNSAPHIRLSYVAAPSPADINDAIRRLATAITGTAA